MRKKVTVDMVFQLCKSFLQTGDDGNEYIPISMECFHVCSAYMVKQLLGSDNVLYSCHQNSNCFTSRIPILSKERITSDDKQFKWQR